VFTFKAVLCDNELDRQFERFNTKALQDLQTLSLGKTVIKDHDWYADNQVARIYATELVTADNTITKGGESYTQLEGYEKAAKKTADEIDKLGKESDDTKDDLKDTQKGADKAADELDDMADSADKAGDATDGLGSKLGGLVKGVLKALGAGLTAAFGALVASAEASREYRTEMGKLETAFTTAGHSS